MCYAVYKSESEKPPIVFRSSNTDVVKVMTVYDGNGTAYGMLVGNREGTATPRSQRSGTGLSRPRAQPMQGLP